MGNMNQQISPVDFRKHHEPPEAELVSAARAGSASAFAELQRRYSRRLYRAIYAITKNHEDAEDTLQDTFLRAFVAIRNFEGRSSIGSWMTRIAINSALMILRKRRSHPEICFQFPVEAGEELPPFALNDSAPNPEQHFDQHQRCARILSAIRGLDPTLRSAVFSRIEIEGSIKEIAFALNITETALKSRLLRARKRLAGTRVFREIGPGGRIRPGWESGCAVSNPQIRGRSNTSHRGGISFKETVQQGKIQT
jgi:RNA polymerase sigma-70 factor, ECF subfamily